MDDKIRVLCEKSDEALANGARGTEDANFVLLVVVVHGVGGRPEQPGGDSGVEHTSQHEEIDCR